ncbi:MAG: hypothetical protein NVS2B16_19330 [Chloroflexota bacterium]
MTRIAVTSAHTIVGRQVVSLLANMGHQVRGFERSAPRTAPALVGAELITADDDEREALGRLVNQCEVVIHIVTGSDTITESCATIVSTTQALAAGARLAGIRRFILLSSMGAEAACAAPVLRALWQAEMIVRQMQSECECTVVRASLLVGSRDTVVQSIAALTKWLPVIPVPVSGDRGVQPIDVQDLARCLVTAATSGDPVGESLPVGGSSYVTYRQVADLIGGILGTARPKLLLPSPLFERFIGLAPRSSSFRFSSLALALFQHGTVASPGVVASTFGFEPRPFIDMLPEYLS